ncbi:MAG: hypothetical protein RL181_691 [Bacteroidota bacterium]|jgi:hypothetical protein
MVYGIDKSLLPGRYTVKNNTLKYTLFLMFDKKTRLLNDHIP